MQPNMFAQFEKSERIKNTSRPNTNQGEHYGGYLPEWLMPTRHIDAYHAPTKSDVGENRCDVPMQTTDAEMRNKRKPDDPTRGRKRDFPESNAKSKPTSGQAKAKHAKTDNKLLGTNLPIVRMKPCQLLQLNHISYTRRNSVRDGMLGVYKIAHNWETIYVSENECNIKADIQKQFSGKGSADLFAFLNELDDISLQRVSVYWLSHKTFRHNCSKKSYLECIEELQGHTPRFNRNDVNKNRIKNKLADEKVHIEENKPTDCNTNTKMSHNLETRNCEPSIQIKPNKVRQYCNESVTGACTPTSNDPLGSDITVAKSDQREMTTPSPNQPHIEAHGPLTKSGVETKPTPDVGLQIRPRSIEFMELKEKEARKLALNDSTELEPVAKKRRSVSVSPNQQKVASNITVTGLHKQRKRQNKNTCVDKEPSSLLHSKPTKEEIIKVTTNLNLSFTYPIQPVERVCTTTHNHKGQTSTSKNEETCESDVTGTKLIECMLQSKTEEHPVDLRVPKHRSPQDRGIQPFGTNSMPEKSHNEDAHSYASRYRENPMSKQFFSSVIPEKVCVPVAQMSKLVTKKKLDRFQQNSQMMRRKGVNPDECFANNRVQKTPNSIVNSKTSLKRFKGEYSRDNDSSQLMYVIFALLLYIFIALIISLL